MKRCPVCQTTYPSSHAQFCSVDGAALAPVDPFVGTTVDGKYQIESRLGAGGMGTVYKARHLLLGRDVAVKVLRSEMVEDANAAERFRREAQAAARLDHPNAVTIYDFGITPDGNAYLVMELLRGTSLRDVLERDGQLALPRAIAIFAPVCAAIDRAHELGIVHRDIKPDNVMVDERKDGSVGVKVVDFGIALLQDTPSDAGRLTGTGLIVGTANYMSPEHCRGEPLDARSDIYSLGVVLYEMLAGRVPFAAPIVSAVIVAHVNEPPPPLLAHRPDLPPPVERVVLDALAKRPDQRPRTAGELASRLVAASGGASAETVLVAPASNATVPVGPAPTGARGGYTTDPQDAGPPQWPATAGAPPPRRSGLSGAQVALIAIVTLAVGFALAAATLGVMNWRDARRPDPPAPAPAPVPAPDAPPSTNVAPPPATNTAPPVTNTAPPQPEPEPKPEPEPAGGPRPVTDGEAGEVEQFLGDWVSSSMARDLRWHMSHYGDVVDYYNGGRVPRARVRADRMRAYAAYDTLDIRIPRIHSMTIDENTGTIRVVLDKQWRFSGPGGTSTGRVKQAVVLARVGGDLKIVAEKDLAVY